MDDDAPNSTPEKTGISRRNLLGVGVATATATALSPLGSRAASAQAPSSSDWTIDLDGPTSALPHFWEECIGGDHAKQALRRDYQDQLVQAHHDLGVKRIRMHGIFDPQMSLYVPVLHFGSYEYPRPASFTQGPYSMFNINQIYDFFVSNGIKPYIEIGFMPPELSRDPNANYVFYYGANGLPPADWNAWADLVTAFTQHVVDRYGIEEVRTWPFEVWNEPNLGFLGGTADDYNTLYKTTANAVKGVDASLQVGGPATDGDGLAYLQNWLNYVESNKLPLDFVSSHGYENNQLSKVNGVADIFAPTKAVLPEGMKYYISETGCNYGNVSDELDTSYAAAFLVKTIDRCDQITDVLSLWCFSDIFEEGSQASNIFYGGFGANTIYGVPKPMYRVFELLHRTGTRRLVVKGTNSAATTGALAVTSDHGQTDLFIYNHAYPGGPTPASETLTFTVRSVHANASATITRIDHDNANPRQAWIDQGSPAYPTHHQLDAMMSASQVHATRFTPIHSERSRKHGAYDLTYKVTVPAEGVAMIHIA
jgi:xylan 1,4-beta-xylosidase